MRKLESWRRVLAGVVAFLTPAAFALLEVSAAMAQHGASFLYGIIAMTGAAALALSAMAGEVPK